MLPAHNRTGQHASVRHSRFAAGTLLALTIVWCVYWFLRARGYWEDDAWIHLEYARSLAAGRGFAFNGLVVPGDTAPLWVIILAAIHLLIPGWLAAGKLLTIVGALFGLSGAYAFARRIAGELLPQRAADIFPAALVLLIAVNPYTCYWLFSGMEVIAAAGLACWAILAAAHEQPTVSSFLAGCALAGLGPLLRPEMLLFPAILALPLLRQLRRINASPRISPLLFAAGAFVLTAPLAVWSCYSLHAFGQLLPSTVAAKRAGIGDSVVIRLLEVYGLGLPLAFGSFVSLPIFLRTRRRLPLAVKLFLLWTVPSLAFYVVNHTYVQTRYALLTAPGMFVIIIALGLAVWPRTSRAIYAVALLWSAVVSIRTVRPFIRNKVVNCRDSAQMALFIRNHLPPTAPVALYSIGQIAFQSEHPIVDIGGITRPGALIYLNAPPGAVLHWAESQGAQYDVAAGNQAPEPGAVPVFTIQTPFVGWSLNPSKYAEQNPVSVWKLAPLQEANSSVPAQP